METDPKEPRKRVSRRQFVKGATATTGAVIASGYVKPNLRSLGVPGALAQVSDPPPPPPPPPPIANDASLELSVSATCTSGQISGQVCVTNASGSGLAVDITSVTLYVEPKGADGSFGGNGNPDETLVTLNGTTGGANPLTPAVFIPGPNGQTTCFSLLVNDAGIGNISQGPDFKVHVVVQFDFHHVHGTRTRVEVAVLEC